MEYDRMSVLTGQTDFSTETAIVEQAERRNMFVSLMGRGRVSEPGFGFLSTADRLRFDFGSKSGLGGLGISGGGNAVLKADQRIPCKGVSWEVIEQSLHQRLAHKLLEQRSSCFSLQRMSHNICSILTDLS
jgi:hypothetical protein